MTDYDWLTKRFLLSVEHLRLWGDNPRLSPDIEYVTTANFADGICSDINERDAFIGRGIKNNANSLSVFEQNAGILSSMIYKQRFFLN